ncbi:MAG TPA: glycosyltransferase family 4 protein [Kofleriaceae bacterium]|nr:glycosyltransferase family 4 protein [Kofleriaceae bacterium]
MSRLKILFCTHTVQLGGAARSLREIIRNWDVEIDLAVPRWANADDDTQIRAFFGERVQRIHHLWLPWSEVYVGRPPIRLSARTHLLFPLTWRAQQRSFEKLVRTERYDGVHLNSLVLHPMLRADAPMTFHVREILAEQHAVVRADAARARGVVFIDEATKKPFEPRLPAKHIVLNNPVDMTSVGTPPPDAARKLGGNPDDLTIFTMVGTLNDEKGVPFAIEAFRQVKSPDVRLVLVGSTPPVLADRIRTLAAADKRIIVWGEERNIESIYTLADYVVRGEPYHCVGRTVYEALYAGCGVVIMGDAITQQLFEFERFSDRIHFYPPRNAKAFAEVIEGLAGKKRTAKRGESNVERYITEFDRFIRSAL